MRFRRLATPSIRQRAHTRPAGVSLLLGLALLLAAAAAAGSPHELVLEGGRVMDPETGLDAVRNVGIREGRIAAIDASPLEGRERLDVSGLVVAPGFIDLHTHSPTPLGQAYQVRDGVTTALELEAGAYPVDAFGTVLTEGARIHYGASVGYASIRMRVKHGLEMAHLMTGAPRPIGLRGAWSALRGLFGWRPTAVFREAATPDERREIRALLDRGLETGGLGIGLPLDYISEAVDATELRMIFEAASAHEVPVFIHVRRGIDGDPAGLEEALALAADTGASLHVCHITHNAMRGLETFLTMIREARAAGVDVTTEILPYNAGSALISSAVFGRDWRTIFGIDYGDVEWAETGERFTEAMWNEYRRERPDGQVIHHYLKEEWTRRALREPGVIVVSDLLPMVTEESKVAPHNGAFARVLGRYARDAGDARPGGRARTHDAAARTAPGALRARVRAQGARPGGRRRGHHRLRPGERAGPRDLSRPLPAVGGHPARAGGRRSRGSRRRARGGRATRGAAHGTLGVAARYTLTPSLIVSSTRTFRRRAGSTAVGSRSSTTKSARFPGASEPLSSASWSWRAPSRVIARSASSTVMRWAGPMVRPLRVVRSTAAQTSIHGSTGWTGESWWRLTERPWSSAERAGLSRAVRAGPKVSRSWKSPK